MNRMKSYALIGMMSALLPTLSMADQTSCRMYFVTAKAGSKNVPVSSDHAATLRNTTGATQVYHVTYSNGIMFTAPWYSPIAEKQFDIAVANGETKSLPNERIMKTANFYTKGNYASQALTVIKLNGKVVGYCENKNTVTIF